MVVIFHLFETFSENPTVQIINHGYLVVDFFYVLSGFVIGYAYDDRWDKMSIWDFYKRRLVRLHPIVIAGTVVGVCYFYLEESPIYPNFENAKPYVFFGTIVLNFLMIPTRNFDVRGWGETNAFDNPTWTLSYEYLANILYSLIIRRLNTIIISILTFLSAFLTINLTLDFDVFNVFTKREYREFTVIGGWSLSSQEFMYWLCKITLSFFFWIFNFKIKTKN